MRVVSLFSGCGGMDLGFVWTGYEIIWANDIDPDACKTYELNIGNHIIEGDIPQINLSTIPDCDVILGGFPCQDFSMIAKTVVELYDDILVKPKKYGMRGQRNFTGKIEDEVRGKLAEHGFGKYATNVSSIELPVDYSLIEESDRKRDSSDFNTIIIGDKKYDLPEGFRISLKSTSGSYLAIPQNELEWEGEIFVLVKLHIKEMFLYKAIKAGLQLSTLNLNDSLGWLEIRGIISKHDFQNGYCGDKLPDNTQLRSPNHIKAPVQLEQDPSVISDILEQVKNSVT